MLGVTNIGFRPFGKQPYVVTGAAGFIGAATSEALLRAGQRVVGVDNFSSYYDPALKRARVNRLSRHPEFELVEQSIADLKATIDLFCARRPEVVIHLAAQPGVAHSTTNPLAYVQSNIVGTMNVFEGCRLAEVQHLVYASSSSVYGAGSRLPFATNDPAGHPISVYAATKRSNELMAHSYSHLFGLPTTGLRFFTVYGPWGRPDMAYYKFALKIAQREPITIYGDGAQRRDFTYVDDIVEAILEVARQPPGCDGSVNQTGSDAPYRLSNVGSGQQVTVNRLVELLEESIGVSAARRHEPARPADLTATQADVSGLRATIGFAPSTPVEVGVKEFSKWFLQYHR
ncbi:MAG: NAD-dependent epimerase/dehydratase family protein [Actinomycetota bacterium]